ncbi:GD19111 [Drosophila simulans]|uniref:GD19111 n=1 Tax=Drosophila simulans TaxID=7240 RepID=B4QWH2_DROSI|nr:GD19111 [Drosophila simulans]
MSLPIYQAPQEQTPRAFLAHILCFSPSGCPAASACSTFTLFQQQLMLIADDRFTNVSFRPPCFLFHFCMRLQQEYLDPCLYLYPRLHQYLYLHL